jgi:hypothetical protein
VLKRSESFGSCRPPGKAMWPDQGSPKRSERRMRRMASGEGARTTATAAQMREGSVSCSGVGSGGRARSRSTRSASANEIGSHPRRSNYRRTEDQADCNRVRRSHLQSGGALEPRAGARAGSRSSGGRSQADLRGPASRTDDHSWCSGSRKSACGSFASGSFGVKRSGKLLAD